MRLPEEFSFSCPLKINCGNRALAHLPIELAAVNAHAPLILASRDQIGKKGLKSVIDAHAGPAAIGFDACAGSNVPGRWLRQRHCRWQWFGGRCGQIIESDSFRG